MVSIDDGGMQLLRDHTEASKQRALNNIRYLYSTRGVSQYEMQAFFASEGVALSQGNISKYLNEKLEMPLGFLAHIGRFFKVSLEDILLRDIQREENREAAGDDEPSDEDCAHPLHALQRMFVTSCAAPEIAALLGTYHCYLFPTKPYPADYFYATFRIYENALGTCSIRMDVRIQIEPGAEPIVKPYVGALYYSKGTMGSHCVIKHEGSGEIVFLLLKTYHPSGMPMQCAIVPVLSMGRGHNSHAPFSHRMLLTREPIRDEDMTLVAPFLRMTSSDLPIRAEDVAACEAAVEAAYGVPDILHRAGVHNGAEAGERGVCYVVSEKALLSAIEASVSKQAYREVYPKILATVRTYADVEKQNKASLALDRVLFDLLFSLGYHHTPYV